ncbi:MAG: CopG family transcriptional regulator [Elusimicrobia bacterium]|nr:CopG family transcriptional regulator [Elusimicrobiota bacterium]
MKKPIYTDEPMGRLHVIPDFLPPPEELFPKREGIKVTLIVDRDSVNFFRQRAHSAGLKYQRMMREVLREYSHRYQLAPTKRSSGRPHTGRR